jgi:hypothetical protein
LGPNNYRALSQLEFAEAGLSDSGGCELARLLTWQAVLYCGVELEALAVKGDTLGFRSLESLGAALSWGLCAPGSFKSEVKAGAAAPERRPVSLQADTDKCKGKLAALKLERGQVDDRLGRAADQKVC